MALKARNPGSFIIYCFRILKKLFSLLVLNVCSNSNHYVSDLAVDVENITSTNISNHKEIYWDKKETSSSKNEGHTSGKTKIVD